MDQPFSNKKITAGLRIFVILTIAGFGLIFYLNSSAETWTALMQFNLFYILVALVVVAIDIISGTMRIYVFIRKLPGFNARKSFAVAFQANLANAFVAATTPFQTGGGLAQIYMLTRHSISLGRASSLSIMNFVATIIFLVTSGIPALLYVANLNTGIKFQFILKYAAIFLCLVLVLFFIFLFKPLWIGSALEHLLISLGNLNTKHRDRFRRMSEKLHCHVEEYYENIRTYWRTEKTILLFNLFYTYTLFYSKSVIAYIILRGVGLTPNFIQVVSIQIFLTFIIYFMPTPGASFLAENTAAAIMTTVIPKSIIPIYSVLWRFFGYYFAVIIGGIFIIRTIGKKREKQTNEHSD